MQLRYHSHLFRMLCPLRFVSCVHFTISYLAIIVFVQPSITVLFSCPTAIYITVFLASRAVCFAHFLSAFLVCFLSHFLAIFWFIDSFDFKEFANILSTLFFVSFVLSIGPYSHWYLLESHVNPSKRSTKSV